ncbi:hypothetical protein Scep_006710 [Stephania cephalantha]|uniref:Pentatricopeptide repeat-containing protein n=1 Tax=Stephania cephalantha TaxID=152367 RepID=A0AAP0PKC5_9MAGN
MDRGFDKRVRKLLANRSRDVGCIKWSPIVFPAWSREGGSGYKSIEVWNMVFAESSTGLEFSVLRHRYCHTGLGPEGPRLFSDHKMNMFINHNYYNTSTMFSHLYCLILCWLGKRIGGNDPNQYLLLSLQKCIYMDKRKNSDNGRCDSYTPMIDIFDEAGRVSSMKYVFQHMQELTLEVDVVTYIHPALLHWFSNNGDFEEMRIN